MLLSHIKSFTLFLSLALLPISTVACAAVPPPLVRVKTSKGIVSGYNGATSNRFVVPYAQPPTGVRRFADPVALTPFALYDATGLPDPCAQDADTIDSTSEDCLYLTIYTPKGVTPTSKLPVFVWVHGGSNIIGSTTDSGLDGSILAVQQNMIVVTVQYRLGLLGFLRSDSLGISGNYALKDLIAALGYINHEIASFGGDPTSITLAGQSSGAELVKSLLVTPSATSLFTRAILHSPPLAFVDQIPTSANAVGSLALKGIKCTTLACLRKASVEQILDAQSQLFNASSELFAANVEGVNSVEPLRVVVDGTLVTRNFANVVFEGGALEGSTKPIIFTTVKDEACEAVSEALQTPFSTTFFDAIVMETMGSEKGPAIIASGLYDPALLIGDEDATRDSLVTLGTDADWTCSIQQSAVNITSHNPKSKIYLAEFYRGISYANDTIPFCVDKVNHRDDIYALFGTSSFPLTRPQIILQRELQARWGAFAKTGSPNSPLYSSVVWQPVASATNLNMLAFGAGHLGLAITTDKQRPAECQVGKGLWGRVVPF